MGDFINLTYLFLFRENHLDTASREGQQALLGVELESRAGADREFVLRCRFERYAAGLFIPGLEVKRRAVSDDCYFHRRTRGRVGANVSLKNVRADGEGFEGGDLKRSIPVDVEYAAYDFVYRVYLHVCRIGEGQLFFGKVIQPCSGAAASAGFSVKSPVRECEAVDTHAFAVPLRHHLIEAVLGDQF